MLYAIAAAFTRGRPVSAMTLALWRALRQEIENLL